MSLLPHRFRQFRLALFSLAAVAAVLAATPRAHAEAKLLLDAKSGKVLYAEKATMPWYPASVTKLMTLYTVLREIKEKRIDFNTLITMTPDATAQQPTKMGFPVGTKLTIDNALKMMMVKSANDVAVAIAEGIGGSIPGFADMMNANAQRLGMTQSHFVNPNGLPAEHHVTSARDLGILARALITQFPEYDSYLHIHSIRYGKRIMRNYNPLLARYPGADGMKTGFICASGYNLVASASRNGHRLIAIVLGAWSGAVRAQQAAELLERGFNSTGLSWLTPSLGTVDALAPVDAQPPDLHDEVCGKHRRKPPSEDNDEEPAETAATGDNDSASPQAFMLSNLNPAKGKFVLGPPADTEPPVVVFTGPADHPDSIATASAETKKAHKKAAHHATAKKQKASAKTETKEPAKTSEKSAKTSKEPKTSKQPAKTSKEPAKSAKKKTAKTESKEPAKAAAKK